MIIANDSGDLLASINKGQRETFSGSYPWILAGSPNPGTNTVYAAFSGGGIVTGTSDGITYSGGPTT